MYEHDATEQAYVNGYEAGYIAGRRSVGDAVEVVHGRWDEDYETFVNDNGYESEPIQTGWICSACGVIAMSASNYCPNCGAKMDLED